MIILNKLHKNIFFVILLILNLKQYSQVKNNASANNSQVQIKKCKLEFVEKSTGDLVHYTFKNVFTNKTEDVQFDLKKRQEYEAVKFEIDEKCGIDTNKSEAPSQNCMLKGTLYDAVFEYKQIELYDTDGYLIGKEKAWVIVKLTKAINCKLFISNNQDELVKEDPVFSKTGHLINGKSDGLCYCMENDWISHIEISGNNSPINMCVINKNGQTIYNKDLIITGDKLVFKNTDLGIIKYNELGDVHYTIIIKQNNKVYFKGKVDIVYCHAD
jgi:hypothetical protein